MRQTKGVKGSTRSPTKKSVKKVVNMKKTTKKKRSVLRRTSTRATYRIYDNGGRPFRVQYNTANKEFTVTRWNTGSPGGYNERVHSGKFLKVFVGEDTNTSSSSKKKRKVCRGNSMLFMLKHGKYMYVGSEIYVFMAKDEIVSYHSPVGPNDVPYPYAVGKQQTTLLVERVVARNSDISKGVDPYEWYYGFDMAPPRKKRFDKVSKLSIEIISGPVMPY